MKKFRGIFLLLFIFITATLAAQTKATKAADDAYADQQYMIALTRYQKAYSKVKKNKTERDRISFRIAECYRMMNNTKKAEISYKRLATTKYADKEPLVILYYADALKTNGNYEEAINQYKRYLEKVPNDVKANQGIETSGMAMDWIKNPSKYDIKIEKKINTKDDEFAPSYFDKTLDNIIFTSDRDASNGKAIDSWTGLEFSDLFVARKDRKGEWATPQPADKAELLNTKMNDGVGKMNARFTTYYFTRCFAEPKKKNGCAIYRISRVGTNQWGEAEPLNIVDDSAAIIGHPTLSDDEGTMYFSAELPGGKGGKDIWKVSRKGKGGNFSKPENLGATINSAGDELFPFIRKDSILYFASNGLPGMGGLDIFRSVKRDDKWSAPENLKYPMNTSADDFGIIFNPEEQEEGYFSSNRTGGKGKDDIYSFVVPPLLFTLEGNVTDDRTLQPVAGAKVQVTGTDGKILSDNTDEKGHYSFNKNQILANVTYEILVSKKDYFSEKGKETTVGLEKSKDLTRDFVLRPIPKKPVVLPDILYDLAKWDLKPQFQDSLQGLIQTLDANENLVIELAAHTDSRDSEERNDILSQKRAQSVVDYLIKRGIDPGRLVARGYGERVPRTLTKDITREGYTFTTGTVLTDSVINLLPGNTVKEAAHALNRRTEFTILRNDFIPGTTSGAGSPEIGIVTNPDLNTVDYTATKDGLEASCVVNGSTMTFEYVKDQNEFFISNVQTLRLLREGLISKEDFKGDASKIIGTGTVADKAVFVIKEMKIGQSTVRDIEVTVNSKIKGDLLLGEKTLTRFGAFTIDDAQKKIIFK